MGRKEPRAGCLYGWKRAGGKKVDPDAEEGSALMMTKESAGGSVDTEGQQQHEPADWEARRQYLR